MLPSEGEAKSAIIDFGARVTDSMKWDWNTVFAEDGA